MVNKTVHINHYKLHKLDILRHQLRNGRVEKHIKYCSLIRCRAPMTVRAVDCENGLSTSQREAIRDSESTSYNAGYFADIWDNPRPKTDAHHERQRSIVKDRTSCIPQTPMAPIVHMWILARLNPDQPVHLYVNAVPSLSGDSPGTTLVHALQYTKHENRH